MGIEGLSLRAIAARLSEQEIATPRHGKAWTAMAVKRALDRIAGSDRAIIAAGVNGAPV